MPHSNVSPGVSGRPYLSHAAQTGARCRLRVQWGYGFPAFRNRSPPFMAMWLIHPQRRDGEVFSSWILRTASELQKSPGSLIEVLSSRRIGWARDIDRFPRPAVIRAFAEGVGVSEAAVTDATFLMWDIALGNLTDRSRSGGNARWHLRYARLPDKPGGSCGMQYCPECLSNSTPYFRKSWRESFVTVCETHATVLRDTCPKCGSRAFYRGTLNASQATISSAQVMTCLNCSADLRPSARSPRPANPAVLALQCRLVAGLDSLEIFLGTGRVNASTVFELMEQIIYALWRAPYALEFRAILARTANISLPAIPSGPKYSFDLAPSDYRLAFIEAISYLLSDWPNNFTNFHREAGERGPMYWAVRSPILSPLLVSRQ